MSCTSKAPIATLILAGTAALFAGTSAHAQPLGGVRYTCTAEQDILVERSISTARVTIADRSYVLRRKASDIGQKYLSAAAALIIDGPSAVFVADDGTDLGNCTKAVPLASAH